MINEKKSRRFEPAQRTLLHQEVVAVIFRSLLEGRIKPGERLVEDDIAEELGVSRSPVRRALVEMDRMGVVDLVPRKGARIKSWSVAEIIDFWRFRVLIEGLAAEQAAERATSDEIERLGQIMHYLQDAVHNDQIERIAELDLDFHKLIVQASRNSSVIASYESMVLRIQIFMIVEKHFYRSEVAYIDSLERHWQVFNAIKTGDANLARSMIEKHIEETVEALINRMKDISEPGGTQSIIETILSNDLMPQL